ncbi:Thioredoxin [Nesidiocoris tenuis]|uniref:Thioredoxin domain-containing protein 9 n=1 Tax=Nesidiocoris tenuis TaxID=355587 RepID=A0ABN7AH78_9HEMI|nr:Thioredoxin [Nesidiocoris tenuis]
MALSTQDIGKKIIKVVENQIDAEIEKLDNLSVSELETIRKERLAKMKKDNEEKKVWLENGHGEYSEIEESEFFNTTKKSKNVIAHFFKSDSPRSKIMDHHLKILAPQHLEAKFVKLDAEKAPFLTSRLNIRVIPTVLIVIDNVTKDKIVGFTDLGNCDDFSTEILKWRLAQSGSLKYEDDLFNPPEKTKQNQKTKYVIKTKKTIRSRQSDTSESDED